MLKNSLEKKNDILRHLKETVLLKRNVRISVDASLKKITAKKSRQFELHFLHYSNLTILEQVQSRQSFEIRGM